MDLGEYGAHLDGDELVLDADVGGTGSPEVRYRLDNYRVERMGPGGEWEVVPLADVMYQLGLAGPIGMWLTDRHSLGQPEVVSMYAIPREISGTRRIGLNGGGGKLHLGAREMDDLGVVPGDEVEFTIRRVE